LVAVAYGRTSKCAPALTGIRKATSPGSLTFLRQTSEMETTLRLLARDGAVFMAFRPSLSGPQYAALREVVTDADTSEEMRTVVQAWARQQNLNVSFDEVRGPV
jgi:hypothetical protein